MTTTEYYCADCGKQLSEDERPCSSCGSICRRINVEITDKICIVDTSLKAKLKSPNIPRTAYEMTTKKKVSGETKRPAKETMIIDRTNQDKTIKKHKVEEWDGHRWTTEHNETKKYKAKHRKKQVL